MKKINAQKTHKKAHKTSAPKIHHKTFPSVLSLYKGSWAALKLCFLTLLKLSLLPLLALLPQLIAVPALLNVFASSSNGSPSLFNILAITIGVISLILFIIALFRVAPASTYVKLLAVRGKRIGARQALAETKDTVSNYFVANLVALLYVLGGFLLLIIPGFFMLKRYLLIGYYVVDHNLTPKAARQQAKELSLKFSSAHWTLLGLLLILNLVGYLPEVGSYVSLILGVMYLLADAVRYQQIQDAR